jgi:hypothetical protein
VDYLTGRSEKMPIRWLTKRNVTGNLEIKDLKKHEFDEAVQMLFPLGNRPCQNSGEVE